MADRIRIVIATPGPDTGDADEADATAVARALRDAGTEVIWTGPHQSPEQIVGTVVQEDADLVGVCGADGPGLERVVALLGENGAGDVVVLAIGDGPDVPGVARRFPTGPDAAGDVAGEVVDWVRGNVRLGGTA